MDKAQFKKRIEKGIEGLTRIEQATFAWQCGVRVLPFLGGTGNFDFWKTEDKQKHLYAIFTALDVAGNYGVVNYNYDVADVNYAAGIAANYAAIAVNSAANSARSVAIAVAYSAIIAADAIVFAAANDDVRAVAYSAAIAAADDDTDDDADDDIRAAAYSAAIDAADNDTDDDARAVKAAVAYSTATAKSAAFFHVDLYATLLKDIIDIKNGQAPIVSIEMYGDVWSNFQKALAKEDCAYWGKLYQDIFDNNFEIDKEALQIRLNIPKEIKAQGAAAVAHYLEGLEKGSTRLNEARIIILGEKGAGKTCLARKLENPKAEMTTPADSTAGVDTTIWRPAEEEINIRIWDFAGHTVTHSAHQFFLSERSLYIMVCNGRREEQDQLYYWLEHMKNYGGDSEAMIFVNVYDVHKVEIPINDLKEKYAIAGVHKFSIKDDVEDLEVFRQTVLSYIKNHPSWEGQKIPDDYFKVKEDLEALFETCDEGKGKEHISKADFEAIAKQYDIEDTDQLLKDLHYLGISLWYENMETVDTLVLNPEWISNGVYTIINWTSNEEKHQLFKTDFLKIFQKNATRYPQEKHTFLFELLQRYELAYKVEGGSKAKDSLIFPSLLKRDRPAKLPAFPFNETLMLQYKSEIPLPSNIISRFIVRFSHHIKKQDNKSLVWRYGVVLENEAKDLALVRIEDRTISVSVKGTQKTAYLTELRTILNEIFSSYKTERPDLMYRVERFGKIPETLGEQEALWLKEKDISFLHKRKKPHYDPETDTDIPVGPIVNNYNINADRGSVILGGKGHIVTQNNFNFQDCNFSLQGDINDLAESLKSSKHTIEAKELEEAAKLLEKVEDKTEVKQVKKSGVAKRLGRIVAELSNEDSKLHKAVKTVKNGVSIAQDIAQGYNDIAEWIGMPQVPKPFLKK